MNTPINGRFVMPDVVCSQFHLREGDLVADFGSGSGFFTEALSKIVGETGKVYACDIQKQLVEALGAKARELSWGNVHPLWCDLEEEKGIKIADGELDAGAVVNTLFMIEDKDTFAKEIARTIRSGGKLFVIDWTESFSGMGPTPEHVITAAEAINLFEAHNFVLEREYEAGEHHYGLAFKKV